MLRGMILILAALALAGPGGMGGQPAPLGDEPESAAPGLAERLPIIEYHTPDFQMRGELQMTPAWFEEQLAWLDASGFTAVSSAELADFVAGKTRPPARSVALTFDIGGPGFAGYETVIIPALRRHGLRAIFFIQASRIRDVCDGQTACWATLREWLAEGLISAESHTLFHQDYLTLSPEQIAYDAGRSKALIEARLGTTVIGLSYPFDSANPAAFPILASLGYRYAVAGHTRAERSALFGDPEPFRLPRYYPYSSPGLYPVLAGSRGQTFGALILEAIQAVEPALLPGQAERGWPAPPGGRGQVWR